MLAKANGEADLRESLAMDRTALANERTILAYVRTALALGAAGASSILFFDSTWLDVIGVLFLLGGALCMAIGVWSHARMKRRLRGRQARAAETGDEPGSSAGGDG